MRKKILLTATVQSHVCQFHKPLVEMLREVGDYEIHVAARNNLAAKNGLRLDFVDRVFDIPFERAPFHPRNVMAYRMLNRVLRENEYECIHCNTPVGGALTRLAAQKYRQRGAKVIYTAHGFHFYRGASRVNWMIYYPIERILSCCTDCLVTVNSEDFTLASAHFPCKVARIHGVGVSDTRYSPVSEAESMALRRELGFSPESRVLLCVGELNANKNQIMAIEAMELVVRRCPTAVLVMAGNGPESHELREQVTARGLGAHVRFTGYCTTLERYHRIADLGISCSKREGLGLNVIEAMLTGNPVVATRNRGHTELIRHGENGFLVEIGDAEGMADCVVRLLENRELRCAMGRNGLESMMPYTYARVKRELRSVYFD